MWPPWQGLIAVCDVVSVHNMSFLQLSWLVIRCANKSALATAITSPVDPGHSAPPPGLGRSRKMASGRVDLSEASLRFARSRHTRSIHHRYSSRMARRSFRRCRSRRMSGNLPVRIFARSGHTGRSCPSFLRPRIRRAAAPRTRRRWQQPSRCCRRFQVVCSFFVSVESSLGCAKTFAFRRWWFPRVSRHPRRRRFLISRCPFCRGR